MKISLQNSRVVELSIRESSAEEGLKVNFDSRFYADAPRNYSIVFEIELVHVDGIELNCMFESLFETEGDINDEFKGSKFISINSPAIAYPFARAAIATILLNCGYAPAMLPAINFTAFHQSGE